MRPGPPAASYRSVASDPAGPAPRPARALIDVGNQTQGAIVRLNLGSFRPYLVTHPRHVQHVLRDRADNVERAGDGLFWRLVKRLFGEGIGEGQIWSASRRMLAS